MKIEAKSFFDRINHGQAYLLLGQDYLQNEIKNSFFSKIAQKLAVENTNNDIYLSLQSVSNNVEDLLQLIQTEADYMNLPDWGKYLSLVYWNGVITTAVEPFVERMFRLEVRDIQPVYQFGRNLPYNFRSKQCMHLSYLYGCVNQMEEGVRPPCSPFDLPKYNANALNLINRIDKEFITPMGALAVDGYDYRNDWLKEDVFFAMCSRLDKGQVYYFGFKEEYLDSIYIKKLVEDGIVIPIQESIGFLMGQAEAEGIISHENDDIVDGDLIISINNERRVFPRNKYKGIKKSCRVLDDYSFDFVDNNTDEDIYKFGDFLYRSSVEPVWEAYYRGMSVVRNFERNVEEKIEDQLRSDTLSQKPIIIYGQSGTGKSVALASLAYNFKMKKKNPVLYIDCRNRDLDNSDIEDFCSWCNDSKVLVFWDLSTHGNGVGRYIELNDYLASKGKKALIIGTSYALRKDIRNTHPADYFEASVELNENEAERFEAVYKKYTGRELSDVWTQKYDNNFLTVLYRLLPGTKYAIRKGLIDEISYDTVDLSEVISFQEKNTYMAQLLQRAGVPVASIEEKREGNKICVGNIIRIVSVIGQYGTPLPFEIVYRFMEGEVSYFVGTLLDRIDFLHVETDMNGNLQLYPRSSLEAEILANSSAIIMEERVRLIEKVISIVTDKEIYFLIELLKAIGPNSGSDKFSFKDYYLVIAEAVQKLRVENGVFNEGTILQEASYVREYFKCYKKEADLEKLISMQKLLNSQIDSLGGDLNNNRKKNVYGQFLIELSSNVGTELMYYCDAKADSSLILSTYERLDNILEKALIVSPDPYYPVDIWGWSIKGVLDKVRLDKDKQNEMITKLSHLFMEVAWENPELLSREDYNSRLATVNLLENQAICDMSENAFQRLLCMKSDSGIYLRAKQMIQEVDMSKHISESDVKKLEAAISYIRGEEFKDVVNGSLRCQYLLLRLTWMSIIKEPLFYKEKTVLSFTKEEWEGIYFILQNIVHLSLEVPAMIDYLLAICEFHMGKESDSFNRFYMIKDNTTYGRRRPVLYYIASDCSKRAVAREFRGQLKSIEKDRERAVFYFPDLRKNLFYYNRDFAQKTEMDKSVVEYDSVHIGFSFMGVRVSEL